MKFILPIEPVGQMRPRFTVKGRHAQAYKDPKQRAEEKALRGDEWCLRENPGGTIGLPMGEGWRSPFAYDEGEEME